MNAKSDPTTQTALVTDGPAVTPAPDEEDLLAGFTQTSTKTQVQLSERDKKMFAAAATHFSGQPNTANLERMFDTDVEADDFRAKVQMYADDHDLSAGMAKYSPEHMSKAVVDPATGKITKPAKLIPANKVPQHWNLGKHVAFRLTPHRDTSKSAGPVISTTVAARAAELAAKIATV